MISLIRHFSDKNRFSLIKRKPIDFLKGILTNLIFFDFMKIFELILHGELLLIFPFLTLAQEVGM